LSIPGCQSARLPRALAAGRRSRKYCGKIARVRKNLDFQIISTANLIVIFNMGSNDFERDAAASGAAGLLLL